MRRILALTIVVATAMVGLNATTVQTQKTWTGWLTNDHCPAKGSKAEHKECNTRCANADAGGILLHDKNAKSHYRLQHKTLEVIAKPHLGHEVTVKGEARGETIVVESIERAKGK